MDGKLQIVGTIWSVVGALMLIVAIVMIAGLAFGVFINLFHTSDLPLLVLSVGSFCAATILVIAAGKAVKVRRPWARMAIIVLSILSLIFFPIGTAVGGYSLWILLSAEGSAAFATE